MVHNPLWNWMDEVEGKERGESLRALKKEKRRQGYDRPIRPIKVGKKKVTHVTKKVQQIFVGNRR